MLVTDVRLEVAMLISLLMSVVDAQFMLELTVVMWNSEVLLNI